MPSRSRSTSPYHSSEISREDALNHRVKEAKWQRIGPDHRSPSPDHRSSKHRRFSRSRSRSPIKSDRPFPAEYLKARDGISPPRAESGYTQRSRSRSRSRSRRSRSRKRSSSRGRRIRSRSRSRSRDRYSSRRGRSRSRSYSRSRSRSPRRSQTRGGGKYDLKRAAKSLRERQREQELRAQLANKRQSQGSVLLTLLQGTLTDNRHKDFYQVEAARKKLRYVKPLI